MLVCFLSSLCPAKSHIGTKPGFEEEEQGDGDGDAEWWQAINEGWIPENEWVYSNQWNWEAAGDHKKWRIKWVLHFITLENYAQPF